MLAPHVNEAGPDKEKSPVTTYRAVPKPSPNDPYLPDVAGQMRAQEKSLMNHLQEQAAKLSQVSAKQNDSTDSLLNERGTTHGLFSDNAKISQHLKYVVEHSLNWNQFSAVQKEGIQMILLKIARACTGDPYYDDNFVDIAGYAQLIVNELKGIKR